MSPYIRWILVAAIISIALGIAITTGWLPLPFASSTTADDEHGDHDQAAAPPASSTFSISPQAKKNLGLEFVPLETTTYTRKLDFPATVVDRPGITDRGVTAPLSGVVAQVHVFPGDAVAPHAPLFTLRLLSDSLQESQRALYQAAQEIEIAQRQRTRLEDLSKSGALPGARLLEIENQIQRLAATAQAHRHDLSSRGFTATQIAAAERGEFVTEIIVRAPGSEALKNVDVLLTAGHAAEEKPSDQHDAATATASTPPPPFRFELESIEVELGEQVEAGAVLCHLGDHRLLLIEARGFKDDMHAVQTAARHGWRVRLELDSPDGDWPPLPADVPIDHISNTVDAATRTFAFFVPLVNQWQTYQRAGEHHVLWRFRPGVRLRVRVPVEEIEKVFVVPREAVVRDGPEAYVFREYGDKIKRRPVNVLLEDRTSAVLANDGSVRAGNPIAQSGAAALNRVLKAESSKGLPAGVHVHADGSVHGAH